MIVIKRLRFAGRYFFVPHCFALSIFCAKVDGGCSLFGDSEVEIWGEVVKVHVGNLFL